MEKTMLAPDSYTMRELMIPIFLDGRCVYQSPKVMDIQAYCKKELDTLWDEPGFPSKEELDAWRPTTRSICSGTDNHMAGLTGMALEMAGITKDTPRASGRPDSQNGQRGTAGLPYRQRGVNGH